MRVEFDQMPDHSRVWIYQADRPLTDSECSKIEMLAAQFVEEWAAHGNSLKSSSAIFHRQFLVLTVDEDHAQASGCSIDSAFKFVRYLENEFDVALTDRAKVALAENNSVHTVNLGDVKSLVEANKLTSDTLVFNNLVTHIGQFREEWITPAGNTWLKKYFA